MNRAPVVVLTAVAATLVQWALVGPVAGVDLLVRSGGPGTAVREVGPGSVALATLAAGLGGWALLVLLRRTTAHPARWWTAAAVGVLLVSLTGPAAATSLSAGLTLAGLHLLAAAVLVPGLLGMYRCRGLLRQPWSRV